MNKNLIVLLSFAACSCTIISPGEVGVRIRFGAVSDEPLKSGVYLWFPVMYGVAKVDSHIFKTDIQTIAASSDMQDVFTTLAINWRLDADKIPYIYKTIGDDDDVYNRIVIPAASESMKYATAQMTAESILKHRVQLKETVDADLKKRLEKYNVIIEDISFVSFSFSKDFSAAIEAKQVAEQRTQQAKYEAQRAEQEAQSAINEAKGKAEAQRLVRETLTPELLKLEAIKKWDGRLPQTMLMDQKSLSIFKDVGK